MVSSERVAGPERWPQAQPAYATTSISTRIPLRVDPTVVRAGNGSLNRASVHPVVLGEIAVEVLQACGDLDDVVQPHSCGGQDRLEVVEHHGRLRGDVGADHRAATGSSGPIPAVKTNGPATRACEYAPTGWGAASVVIAGLFTGLLL